MSSIYIFVRFINSLPKPWLNKVGYINKTSCGVSEVKVKVSIVVRKIGFLVVLVLVLALAKSFLKR